MTKRPTKEQVDEDLASVHAFYGDEPEEREWRLAAEVRALRDELQEAVERADGYSGVVEEVENANEELRATIARVEAMLPANERGFLRRNELLALLRGPT